MRIYLQTPTVDDKPPRFYHLMLQEDLLDGWTLVSESGQQGSPGRVKRQYFSDRDAAVDALVEARNAQLKKGFRVVFAVGQENT